MTVKSNPLWNSVRFAPGIPWAAARAKAKSTAQAGPLRGPQVLGSRLASDA